ncbi:MAG: DNA polymerase III subunit alpha [Holophagales bacterium]|nr:DNA polymerase III subunit alpha [Holophagales bacterium]
MGETGPPARDMFMPGDVKKIVSPGARKEELRKRSFGPPSVKPKARWAELRAASAFSFLEGASEPETLVERAAELGLPAVALVDRNGLSGAPRFWKAARTAGLKAIVGAEVVLDEAALPRDLHGPLGLVPPPPPPGLPPARVTLLVESQAGYRNLSRLLTAAALGKPKGQAAASWADIAAHAEGLHVLSGGLEGPVLRALERVGYDAAEKLLSRLAALFPGRLHVELQRHRVRDEEARNAVLLDLARAQKLPLVATNGTRYARRRDKDLFDVLTCIRQHTTVDEASRLLEAGSERHLKGPEEMAALFADLPAAVGGAADLADRLAFTLADLGYRFPDAKLPPGETPSSWLRQKTWEGARGRFQPLTARAQDQLQRELDLIAKLDLAGYFLVVHDVIEFCKRENILVQGRGSAANSAVCYALSITAIDPVKMELLFERFLSEERGEWPDIDLDLPSGDAREKVIQHVYATYGVHGAAMTANTITYRDRSAARETAKALGFSTAQVDTLAKRLATWSFGEYRDAAGSLSAREAVAGGTGNEAGASHGATGGSAPGGGRRGDAVPSAPPPLPEKMADEMRAAGFDPDDVRLRHFGSLFRRIQNLPRHLGQHSGGMVVAGGRLDEVVPLEPAAMPGRVVIQWDKDDCADLGIIKIDLLGLGMLGAIAEMVPTIRSAEGVHVDLAHLPHDDPAVYEILNKADTVGLFQVESRAQMASLPRNAPRCFYDIVIQVAIIRPGPIQGGMVHPFFDRRQGRIPVEYPHPSLEPILKRTLGVPLFQEQLLKIAMVAAGFTGGEAEELRRAMGFKRSSERMAVIETRLRSGMTERGITGEAQEQIVRSITSFALYGFPESHAASFALIAWASGWLKVHHPAAFLAGILNAWPMGFYHPATLVKDAQHHGTDVLPIDVTRSGRLCRTERLKGPWPKHLPRPGPAVVTPSLAVRLGLRFVRGLRASTADAIEREQARAPFAGVKDLARRASLREDELSALAHAGAFATLPDAATGERGLSRRTALWQAASAARDLGPLYDTLEDDVASPLPEMSRFEETVADYQTSEITAGPHLIAHFRAQLKRDGILSAAELSRAPDGSMVKTAGVIVVRQRPGTAKGFVFLSLEDETGMCQAILRPDLFKENRALVVGSPALVVEGRLQKKDGTLSIRADRFERMSLEEPIPELRRTASPPYPRHRESTPPSHDFR